MFRLAYAIDAYPSRELSGVRECLLGDLNQYNETTDDETHVTKVR